MKNRLAKTAASFAMAAVLSFTSIAAYAEEVSDAEGINGIDFEIYSNWGIEDHAENIKATYKLDYPEQASIIDEIVDVISGSEEFAGIFEEEGEAAFRIIEDSLQDVLRPSESPCDNTDELYFSKYELLDPIIQSSPDMNAAAATLMALIGSGVSTYTEQTEVQKDLDNTTASETINKITELLHEKIPDKNGYSVKTRAFVPINGSAYSLINCIETALALDTVPVIQVEGDYYGSSGSGKHYIVATCVDIVAECITIFDPVGKKDYIYYSEYYNEWDNLLTKSGVIWVSAYGDGNRGAAALAKMMAEYPEGSYYNTTGIPCTCHDWCGHTSSCTCLKYKDNNGANYATQCAGFAMQVYDVVMGRRYCSSESTRTKTINQTLTASTAKKYLKGRAIGTYVRVKSGSNRHSVAIINTSETGITVYQANYGVKKCMVSYVTYSWEVFAQNFPYLYYYVD